MRTSFISVIAMTILTSVCTAETIEIPLPGLHGLYSMDGIYDRSTVFHLPRDPIAVHGAWIILSGNVNAGQHECDIIERETFGTPLNFITTIPDTVNGNVWWAEPVTPDTTGDYERVNPFRELYGAPVSWDFLLSGYGIVRCQGTPPPLIAMCWITIMPNATIDSAILRIEADFSVSTENSTWGSIKSQYR